MNLAEMRRRVQHQFGDTTGAHLTNTMVHDWLNDGISEFIRDVACTLDEVIYYVPADENTVQYEYPVMSPVGSFSTDGLIIDGGAPVFPEDEDPLPTEFTQFQKINRVVWYPGGETDESRVLMTSEEAGLDMTSGHMNPDLARGEPQVYYFVGGSLRLYPTPDADGNLKVTGLIYPPALSSDADIPRLPLKYHRDIVTFALWQAAMMDNDWERAQQFKINWMETKGNAVSDQENPNMYSYATVKVVD